MYGERRSSEFIGGLHKFIDVAEANKVDNFMPCPCVDCQNVREYSNSKTIQGHVIRRGFMPSYNCWTKHGERGVRMEDNDEEEDDDNYPMFSEDYGDTVMDEDNEEEGGEQRASDEPVDDLGRVISDAKPTYRKLAQIATSLSVRILQACSYTTSPNLSCSQLTNWELKRQISYSI